MDFSALNTSLWSTILQFGVIAIMLLLANVLRRKLPFIRKTLMPTAVLAGFITLILRVCGLLPLNVELLEIITYHTIAIGFIALTLQIPEKRSEADKKNLTGAKSGALIVSCYLLQGFFGLLITTGLAFTIMPGLFKASGIILPMGFGQGPGQANNVGSSYEALGFVGGQSFGLSIAAMGFLVACVVGVIYINILKKRGKISPQHMEYISGSITVDYFQSDNELPVSESVDRFSVQLALILAIYLLTYLTIQGIDVLLSSLMPGLAATVLPILWGFNFIIGALLALVVRQILAGLTKIRFMTHQYANNYLLGRISGAAFDLMVICGIAAINFGILRGLWLPFVLLSAAGTFFTLFYLQWICKKLYPDYCYEGLLSMYGMMTGTISSGVLLLRELDPSFKTPAANNLLIGTSFGIAFGIPILILIGLAPKSDFHLFLTIGLIVVYFAILLLFMLKAKVRGKQQ